MHQHIVTSFSDELDQLSAALLQMGGLAETMISDACQALTTQNRELAELVISRNLEMDKLESDCQRDVTRLLALRQPMASDLRMVVGAIKIAGSIERIGHLSKNTAQRSIHIMDSGNISAETKNVMAIRGIERMGRAVSRQLQIALDGYARRDADAALRVIFQDDDIDSHYNALLKSMLVYMTEDRQRLDERSNFLFIVKNLERIGDHCSNVAKVVHFIATGNHILNQNIEDKQAERSDKAFKP